MNYRAAWAVVRGVSCVLSLCAREIISVFMAIWPALRVRILMSKLQTRFRDQIYLWVLSISAFVLWALSAR